MAEARSIVPASAKPGSKVSTKIGPHTVVENRKDLVILRAEEPLGSFTAASMQFHKHIDKLSRSGLAPQVVVAEQSKYITECLTDGLKKIICPELYNFEKKQNQRFAEKVAAEKRTEREL